MKTEKIDLIRIKHLLFLLSLIILCFLLFSNYAEAQSVYDKYDPTLKITGAFKSKGAIWEATFQKYALELFRWLLIIEVAYLGIRTALTRPNLAEVIGNFALLMVTAGFFFALIKYYPDWTQKLLNGFLSLVNEVEPSVEPKSPLSTALNIIAEMWEKISIWDKSLGKNIASLSLGLALLGFFAYMTARIIFVLCETYITMTIAIIILGLGAFSHTRSYAISAIRYAFSVALKLFTLYLIIGIGFQFLNHANIDDLKEFIATVVISFIICLLSSSLPDAIAGIINGSHSGSGMQMISGIKAAAGAAIAVGAAVATGGASAGAGGAAGGADLASTAEATSVAGGSAGGSSGGGFSAGKLLGEVGSQIQGSGGSSASSGSSDSSEQAPPPPPPQEPSDPFKSFGS